MIADQLQNAPVGLSRQVELVFQFLYLPQAGCSQYGGDDIPGRLGDELRLRHRPGQPRRGLPGDGRHTPASR